MTCELLLDVDVVIKLAAYDLLADIAHPGCDANCSRNTGVTATTKYVATSHIKRRALDPDAVITRLERYLASAAVLEPTEVELRFAAKLESEANRTGVALDTGESQLCAIAILRSVPGILTGDKRAIEAAESLVATVPRLAVLASRVGCLEQAINLGVERLSALAVRSRVLAEKKMDIAICICFQCSQASVPNSFEPVGLVSYINNVRSAAPILLMPGYALAVPSVT